MALDVLVLSEELVLERASVLEEPAPDTVSDGGGGGGGGGASCWGLMPFSFNTSSTAFLMTVIKSVALLVLELAELEPVESVVSEVLELSDVVLLFEVRKA